MARVTRSKKIDVAADETATSIPNGQSDEQKSPLTESTSTTNNMPPAQADPSPAELNGLKAAFRTAIGVKKGKKGKGRKKNAEKDAIDTQENTGPTEPELPSLITTTPMQPAETQAAHNDDIIQSPELDTNLRPGLRSTRSRPIDNQIGQSRHATHSTVLAMVRPVLEERRSQVERLGIASMAPPRQGFQVSNFFPSMIPPPRLIPSLYVSQGPPWISEHLSLDFPGPSMLPQVPQYGAPARRYAQSPDPPMATAVSGSNRGPSQEYPGIMAGPEMKQVTATKRLHAAQSCGQIPRYSVDRLLSLRLDPPFLPLISHSFRAHLLGLCIHKNLAMPFQREASANKHEDRAAPSVRRRISAAIARARLAEIGNIRRMATNVVSLVQAPGLNSTENIIKTDAIENAISPTESVCQRVAQLTIHDTTPKAMPEKARSPTTLHVADTLPVSPASPVQQSTCPTPRSRSLDEIEKADADVKGSMPMTDESNDSFVQEIIARSPSKPAPRIEDSLAALDHLEDALDAVGEAIPTSLEVPQARANPVKPSMARSVQGKAPSTSSVSRKPVNTARRSVNTISDPKTSSLQRSQSLKTRSVAGPAHKPVEDGKTTTRGGRDTSRRPVSMIINKAAVKSDKPLTSSTFELPGEAVARKLKAQKEARLAQRSGAEAPAATTTSKIRSAKPPTKSTFELPGEVLSRQKRELHEARAKAQEEEQRRKREFKARPVGAAKPAALPRETAASRARQSMVSGQRNTPSLVVSKRASITGVARTATNAANSSAPRAIQPKSVTGKPSITIGNPPPVGNRVVSDKDVQLQRQRAKEIYNRDAKFTEDIERERKEREAAAKKSREEAAERGRQASREWAERQKAKKAAMQSGQAASIQRHVSKDPSAVSSAA